MIAVAEVIYIHDVLIQRFGGAPGIRDEGLLESALARPFQTQTTEYYLKATQCKLTTWDTVTVTVTPRNISITNSLSNSSFTILYKGVNLQELKGELFNSVGQLIKTFTVSGSGEVSTAEFAAGIYYCRISNGRELILMEKIVKAR